MQTTLAKSFALTLAAATISVPDPLLADVFHTGTGAIDGFLCVGTECNDYNTASGRTLVLKEDSVQLVFEDDSDAPFPSNDFEIRINDGASNGDNYFAIRDVDANRTMFRLDAGAPLNGFVMATNGNIGLGTILPQADLHIVDSLDAYVRLETTSSGGFQWDVLGNRTNFIIRDVPNGTLPFRLFPDTPNGMLVVNAAGVGINTNDGLGSVNVQAALDVNGNALIRDDLEVAGDLGIGTDTPAAPLHVSSPGAFSFFRIEALGASPNTAADMTFTSGPSGSGGEYRINVVDGDGPEMRVDGAGFVTAFAGFRVGATNLNVPDYVFEPDYALRPLSEVASFIKQNKHLPDVPSAGQVAADGLDMTQMQMALLKKVEELTLYTLEQQEIITAQNEQNTAQEMRIARLEQVIETLARP